MTADLAPYHLSRQCDLKATLAENRRQVDFSFAHAPHALVAGSTNCGKSVTVASILTGVCEVYAPNELELVLVDLHFDYRADEVAGPSRPVTEEIIKEQVRKARLIVADLTGKNPNVTNEVGMAIALNKKIILRSQTPDDVPFNLRWRDGSKIAFVSDRDGDREIYVMNSDDSGQTRLTYSSTLEWSPAWKP